MIVFAGDAHKDFVPLIEEAGEAVVLLGDQKFLLDRADELGP
jgi:hypothetical protein